MNNTRVTRPEPKAGRLAHLPMALAATLFSLALVVPAKAQTYTSIDCPGRLYAHAYGINDFGAIVGDCEDQNGNVSGFLLRHGAYTMIDVPGALVTTAWDINNLGAVVGDYVAEDGFIHGFLFREGRFTTIDFPGASDSSAQGLDDFGRIVGIFIDDTGAFKGFLSVGGKFQVIEFPPSEYTTAVGINALKQIVGSSDVRWLPPEERPAHENQLPGRGLHDGEPDQHLRPDRRDLGSSR